MKVTVIIPVYRAAKYLEQGVTSALDIGEVGEVLLVEDGSPDNALDICLRLQERDPRIRVLQHPNGENRGAGASRNLGISHATCEYVAFLDADDWYLPNRFTRAKEIFGKDPSVDGVYEATACYLENTGMLDDSLVTTINKTIAPDDLLLTLLQGRSGYFHTNAITVRKSLFARTGVFDESLRLHQDTHLWLRFAYAGKLVPGSIGEPVAVRRTHDENRIAHKNRKSIALLDEKVFAWFASKPAVDRRAYRIMFLRAMSAKGDTKLQRIMYTIGFLARRPRTIGKLL